jgi:hypothetical protein
MHLENSSVTRRASCLLVVTWVQHHVMLLWPFWTCQSTWSRHSINLEDPDFGVPFTRSDVKSGSTCDFIAFRFSYMISRGESSISQRETRSVTLGLFRMLDRGASLTTTIGCSKKLWRSWCM